MDPVKNKLDREQPEYAFTKKKRTAAGQNPSASQPLPEEENYKDCHLGYFSEWSRMIDLKERGRAKAGELWDVTLEKGFKHNLV